MICYQQTILNLSSQFVMIVFHWYLILFLSDPDRSRCNNRRSNSNSRRACTCRTLHWPIAYHITSYRQEKVHWWVGWLVGRHVHTLLAAAFHLTVPHPLSCFSGVTSSRSLNLDIFAACIILILSTAAILEESSDFIIGYHRSEGNFSNEEVVLDNQHLDHGVENDWCALAVIRSSWGSVAVLLCPLERKTIPPPWLGWN